MNRLCFGLIALVLMTVSTVNAATFWNLKVDRYFLDLDVIYVWTTTSGGPTACKTSSFPFWSNSGATMRINTTGTQVDVTKSLLLNAILTGELYDYDLSVSGTTCDILAIGNW